MKIRVIGGGWYGCHLAAELICQGHDVEVHEARGQLFAGASGANPARLHLGFHYPRSKLTRAMCQEHQQEFMEVYGRLTGAVRTNIYAVAETSSLVDFGTFRQVMQGEVEFVTLLDPEEFGLRNVEGALLTGERHVLVGKAREYFTKELGDRVRLNAQHTMLGNHGAFDWNIDATFCALGSDVVDRYEPCVTAILQDSRADTAITIMDGPFPSIYPWDPARRLSSLTSASLTPLSKTCKTWQEAKSLLDDLAPPTADERVRQMIEQMAFFWPSIGAYRYVDYKLAIRAMPRSGADARLCDVAKIDDRLIRVRPGKIDAIFAAAERVKEIIGT